MTEDIAFDADPYRDVPDDEMTEMLEDPRQGEAEAAEEAPEQPKPVWAEKRTVTVFDRDFAIGPPNIGITLRIINVFGQVGVRGERVAALQVEDVIALGSAVLQFEDDREGRGFLRKAPEGKQIPLSPIVRALFLNVMQSEDLRDCLVDFFDGLRMTEGLLGDLSLDLA